LFGHEKGAFPGAFESRSARCSIATEARWLLDEIDRLPLPVQERLLEA
jgi:transcriptional regulator with GAF, ATPase, and Fis domain